MSMIDYTISDNSGARLVTIYDTDENGPFVWEFYLGSIAVYRELLGYDDPLECLKAFLQMRRDATDVPEGPHGETVWSDLYVLLAARENAREHAALVAEDEAPEETQYLAADAAYDAVHQPIGGGECVIDRCRRSARDALGLEHPESCCGEESRTEPVTCPEPWPVPFGPMREADQEEAILASILAGQEDFLLGCTQEWLHSLTENDRDPISPEQPYISPPPPGFDEVATKYQEAARE